MTKPDNRRSVHLVVAAQLPKPDQNCRERFPDESFFLNEPTRVAGLDPEFWRHFLHNADEQLNVPDDQEREVVQFQTGYDMPDGYRGPQLLLDAICLYDRTRLNPKPTAVFLTLSAGPDVLGQAIILTGERPQD